MISVLIQNQIPKTESIGRRKLTLGCRNFFVTTTTRFVQIPLESWQRKERKIEETWKNLSKTSLHKNIQTLPPTDEQQFYLQSVQIRVLESVEICRDGPIFELPQGDIQHKHTLKA